MSILFVVLYGLLTGFFEVLPVSPYAHQALLAELFGAKEPGLLYQLFLHIAVLAGLLSSLRPSLLALAREQKLLSGPRRRARSERKFTYELRYVKTAAICAGLATVVVSTFNGSAGSLFLLSLLSILNGAVVLVPEYLPYGNKSAKHMNRLDAVMMGVLSCLGSIPGLSRISAMLLYTSLRGADKTKAVNWVLLTSIPVLAVILIFDVIGLLTVGVDIISFSVVLSYILGTVVCFFATIAGITLIRFLSAKVGFVGFGYYSIGAGLIAFFLYLTV